jgi:ribonuclease HI
MPGKSTVDAALTFTHDIEAARKHQMVTSALTFDITGAFDFVSHPRLLTILREKQIPLTLVKWVASFLRERRTAISLDGILGDMSHIQTGIPQGSPVSPILFLFASSGIEEYVQAGFKDDPQVIRGLVSIPIVITYIDDGMIYISSSELSTNVEYLQKAYARAQDCLKGEGMRVDQVKRELMHYSCRPRDKNVNPSITLPGPNADSPTTIVKCGGTVKWLGIIFDRKLLFTAHVRALRDRAEGALACLKMLANTQSGLHQTMCRQLYVTCVLPILTYASIVWFKGEARGSKGNTNLLDMTQRKALRWITGAFRTTPIHALQLDAALMPMTQRLTMLSGRYATRIRTFDTSHPIVHRLPNEWRPRAQRNHPNPPAPPMAPCPKLRRKNGTLHKAPTHLHSVARQVDPKTETTDPFLTPPWRRTRHDDDIRKRITVSRATPGITKPEAAREHRKYAAKLEQDPTHLLAYTDGSQLIEEHTGFKNTGAGIILYCQGIKISEIPIGMGREAEGYDAELLGLAYAADCAIPLALRTETDDIPTIRQIHFFADNDAAVGRMVDHTPKPGQEMATSFWNRALEFLDAHPDNTIEISWIPGHQDIDGNEAVDATAKLATALRSTIRPTLTHARRKALAKVKATTLQQWNNDRGSQEGFSEADHFPPRTKPRNHFLHLPRRLYALVLQCRTGHSFTGEYYNRHVPSEEPECPCGAVAVETRDHIFAYCQRYDEERYILEAASEEGKMEELLGTDNGIAAVAEFIRMTGAFTKKGRERREAREMDPDE